MAGNYGVDLTNCKIGGVVPYVDEEIPIVVCPYCGRAGLNLFGEIGIFSHVISFQCADEPHNSWWCAPFWSSDLCREDGGRWSISWPAIGLPNRIRHPKEPADAWTQEQIDTLKSAFESGFAHGPTAYSID